MVERTFPDGLEIPISDAGAEIACSVVDKNGALGVTWVHSYVSGDRKKTFCIYDGPDEDSIRKAAAATGLPVDTITPVSVLDPYFYH
jgi:hypothetical protein